jgi:antitoxin component of MazEF toxin-antitoxin module
MGHQLEMEVHSRTIVIQPAASKPTLEELLDAITPENCHPATDWGQPAGKEEW